MNIMTYATYQKLGKTREDLIKTNMVPKDFEWKRSDAKGILNADFTIGSKILLTTFFIIDDKGVLRQITINDLPVGRSVDEVAREIIFNVQPHIL